MRVELTRSSIGYLGLIQLPSLLPGIPFKPYRFKRRSKARSFSKGSCGFLLASLLAKRAAKQQVDVVRLPPLADRHFTFVYHSLVLVSTEGLVRLLNA
jgi:hypothetical protein